MSAGMTLGGRGAIVWCGYGLFWLVGKLSLRCTCPSALSAFDELIVIHMAGSKE